METPDYTSLESRLDLLLGYYARRETPAEPMPLQFDGTRGILEVDDNYGMRPARSYGIFNPVRAKVYVGLQSGGAAPESNAFVIPAQSFVVIPVEVVDNIRVGINPAELGEDSATIYRFKYASVQPAYAFAL